MNLEELQPGLLATIIVSLGQKHMEFNTMIEEVNAKKKTAYIPPVLKDDKPISFNSNTVQTHLLVFFPDRTPQVFRNVKILLARRDRESLCYTVTSTSSSVDYNRRKHYRCYIGLDTTIMVGAHHSAYDAVLKDLSIGGFSFTMDSYLQCSVGDMVHFVLKEYIDELKENFQFSIYGIVVEARLLENDKTIYGCRITSNAYGIDSYIAKKERLRLQKTRGSLSSRSARR